MIVLQKSQGAGRVRHDGKVEAPGAVTRFRFSETHSNREHAKLSNSG